MAIGANWMSAATYLGVAATVAISGVYGLAYVIGWTTGYFILLIFMAAQMRRFGKYTAPDFVGDRFNSDAARALAALTTFLIGFVYALGQARGMGLVGLYILGDWSAITGGALSAYQTMMVIFMVITVAYLSLSGMLGATKNMVLQYVILIVAFLLGLVVTGWSGGFTTVLPQLEYGMMIDTLGSEFSAPFAGGSYYLWVATCFSLVFGTCGLPHAGQVLHGQERASRPLVVHLGAVLHLAVVPQRARLRRCRNRAVRRRGRCRLRRPRHDQRGR